MVASNWVHLDFGKILRVTDRALLVRLEDGEEDWFPLSQIADSGDYKAGDTKGTISITEWLAKEKGLD